MRGAGEVRKLDGSRQPMLEARNLHFRYPPTPSAHPADPAGSLPGTEAAGREEGTPALEGIDLVINRGEYVALVGANGSGKTTLLKHFNALLTPTRGEVLVGGLSTALEENYPAIRRQCGMIFQNPDNQIVATTVEEDVAFGLENYAVEPGEMRHRVAETLKLLGLSDLARRPPHHLSGGQKQRVAIAGILALQPSCILMDEPTAMLDRSGRREVLSTVTRLNRDAGITVIHVTHFPDEAALAKRVLVLHRGRIAADGPPEEVLSNLDLLHTLGLEGTPAAEAAALLRAGGLALPPHTYRLEELLDYLGNGGS